MRPLLDLALLLGGLVLPALLIYSSISGYREVTAFKQVYLRSRAVTIRNQIALAGPEQWERVKSSLEPQADVLGVRLRSASEVASSEGIELGRRQSDEGVLVDSEREGVYRALIRLGEQSDTGEGDILEVELRADTGDALIRDALEHLVIAFLAALGSVGTLAAYLLLSRRTSKLERLAEIGTMSAALAHEIRNPLGTIKGFAQLSRQAATEKVGGFQDLILREVGRLEKLVNDLLSFSRPREPRFQLANWSEIQSRLPPPGTDSGVSLEYVKGKAEVQLETDPDLVVEILHNLIRNALEATESGRVRVGARVSEGWAVIHVDDDGPGLPPNIRARIFEPFFSTKPTGTGLGLPICRSLADRLGGKLSLASRRPKGTRAEIRIPLAASAKEN